MYTGSFAAQRLPCERLSLGLLTVLFTIYPTSAQSQDNLQN
jgi:hypothetical protein